MMPRASTARKNQDLPESLNYFNEPYPLAKIIELRNKQLSLQQIADIVGVTKQSIHYRLKPYVKSIDSLGAIKNQRADLLALVTNNMLEVYLSLTPAEQKSLVMKRGMVDYGILYDKMRLETGQSTSNVAYMDLIKARQQLQSELRSIPCAQGEAAQSDTL